MFAIFFFTILSFGCYAQSNVFTPPSDYLKVNGNAKSVVEYLLYKHDESGKNHLNEKTIQDSTVFDHKRNPIELYNYYSNNLLNAVFYFSYFDNNNLKTFDMFMPRSNSRKTDTYTYNKKKLLQESEIFVDSVFYGKYNYTYNNKNQRSKEEFFSQNNQLSATTTYLYDKNSHLIEEKRISSSGVLENKMLFKYDCDNNRIEQRLVGLKDSIDSVTQLVYDQNKNIVVRQESSSRYVWFYSFDALGNKISETTIFKDSGAIRDYYSYKYEYDEKGNWIKMEKFKAGTLIKTAIRVIEYYD